MDKHTLTLDEYIKIKLRKGESEFDVGIRYTCGDTMPSKNDKAMTQRLREAGEPIRCILLNMRG